MQQLAQNQLDFIKPIMDRALSVLGLALPVTLEQIKKAYRKKALKYHPDKGGDEKTMKEIVNAYELLIGKTKLRIPPPQRVMRQWVCINVGSYTYDGTASAGTTSCGW